MQNIHKKLLVGAVTLVGLLGLASANSGLIQREGNDPKQIPAEEAHQWAFNHKITKFKLEDANLDGTIRRYELAKMLSQFHTQVLGKEIVSNPACDITLFEDYNTFDVEMAGYVQDVCDLGLMGWNKRKTQLISNFMPYMTLSPTDFNTVIIRYITMADMDYDFKLTTSVARVDVFRFLYDMSK